MRTEPKNFEEAVEIIMKESTGMLVKKGKDYGRDNINIFGLQGVVVRLSDKIMRLKQFLFGNHTYSYESLDDTIDDTIGYAILAKMQSLKTADGDVWYNLPFRKD